MVYCYGSIGFVFKKVFIVFNNGLKYKSSDVVIFILKEKIWKVYFLSYLFRERNNRLYIEIGIKGE